MFIQVRTFLSVLLQERRDLGIAHNLGGLIVFGRFSSRFLIPRRVSSLLFERCRGIADLSGYAPFFLECRLFEIEIVCVNAPEPPIRIILVIQDLIARYMATIMGQVIGRGVLPSNGGFPPS